VDSPMSLRTVIAQHTQKHLSCAGLSVDIGGRNPGTLGAPRKRRKRSLPILEKTNCQPYSAALCLP